MLRRPLLAASLALMAVPAARAERSTGPLTGPLRLGVDRSLAESGLAHSLQHAFGADTGIAVKLVPGPALAVLDAVRDGEVDAALTNAPAAEAKLERQGLVHDWRPIAEGEFILVGPTPPRLASRGRQPPPGRSGVDGLVRIRELAATAEGLVFLSAGDGSGAHVAEQELWRAARIEPMAPWYLTAATAGSLIDQARARGAYAVVERGAWAAQGGAPLAVLVEDDPTLGETVHAMRSFRVTHPAGRIFVGWISGARGRAVVAAHRGYRAPARG